MGRFASNVTTEVLVKNVMTVLSITQPQEIVHHVGSLIAKHVPKQILVMSAKTDSM